jgi:uncharacterized membrane protein YczE
VNRIPQIYQNENLNPSKPMIRLTAPSLKFFLTSLALFLFAVAEEFSVNLSPFPNAYAFIAAWVVLAVGCVLKGV